MVKNSDYEHIPGSPPLIDPTKLTTDAVNIAKVDLRREMQVAEERRSVEHEALRETLSAEIERIEEVTDQRFKAIAREFEIVERGRIEQKTDTKQAVDAALIAQKEAVKEQTTASEKSIEKSENATTKQIDALGNSFTQAIAGVNSSLNDLKERVVTIEAGGTGRSLERQETRDITNKNVNIVYVFIGGLSFIGASIGIALIATGH